MRFRGILFALAAVAVTGGCAAGTAGAPAAAAPVAAANGRVYAPGTRPTATAQSRTGTLMNAQGNFQEAMNQARAGIAANPANPIHYYIAGEAAAGLGDYVLADSLWKAAEAIYPAYERDIEPTREQYWGKAFNEGVEFYNAGNAAGAITAWRKADLIYKLRPTAVQNLGVVLAQENQYDEAIAAYRRGLENLSLTPATRQMTPEDITERDEAKVAMQDNLIQLYLFTDKFAEAEAVIREAMRDRGEDLDMQARLAVAIAGQGPARSAEATQIYNRILSAPNVPPSQLFGIGVALFNANEPRLAANAFGRVTQLVPNSRDAWYNQANALYEAKAWADLVPVALRHTQIDPLSKTGLLILTQAYVETMQEAQSLASISKLDVIPVFVDELSMEPGATSTSVTGVVEGNAAAAGTPIRLRFTFYNEMGGEAGSEMVTVAAPAREQKTNFTVTINQVAVAYRYEQVQ